MYILFATGEGFAGSVHGLMRGKPEELERLWARIGEPPPAGDTFVDRHGDMHCGWVDIEEFARRFAVIEPGIVIDTIDSEERQLSAGAKESGQGWMLDRLRELGPAFALLRQWVGAEQERAGREAEIQRLQRLVWGAIWDLRRLGHDSHAERLERALHGA